MTVSLHSIYESAILNIMIYICLYSEVWICGWWGWWKDERVLHHFCTVNKCLLDSCQRSKAVKRPVCWEKLNLWHIPEVKNIFQTSHTQVFRQLLWGKEQLCAQSKTVWPQTPGFLRGMTWIENRWLFWKYKRPSK